MPEPHCEIHTSPSIYALTAATVIKLLTKRLGAAKVDVDWEEATDSECDDDARRNRNGHGDAAGTATGSASGTTEFAPRGMPKTAKAFKGVLPPPLKVRASKESAVAGLMNAFARAVKAKPSDADNARFIEHFRYILAASQLLDENTSQAQWRTNPPSSDATPISSPVDFNVVTPASAIATGVTALTLIWLVYWSRWNLRSNTLTKKKLLIIFLAVSIVAMAFYVYARRQLLLYLRAQAISNGSAVVTNLQSFDAASSNAIQFIQEVELVSRGYRLSVPMPPITRIEHASQSKRCGRLRKSLQRAFASTLPVLSDACNELQNSVDEDDLERYLDIYDVNNDDVREAAAGWRDDEFEDLESLKALRIHQYRFITLRRLFLCSLMSLEADGHNSDFVRWRIAGETMQRLAAFTGDASEKVGAILTEEESFDVLSTTSTTSSASVTRHSRTNSVTTGTTTPTRERLRRQLRSLATLSSGIRQIQAKMQIMREDSTSILCGKKQALSASSKSPTSATDEDDAANDDDVHLADLGNSLLAHYDAIGTDLKSLVQAWESGRNGLAMSVERAERRVSRMSLSSFGPTGRRSSPANSLGGLAAVEESTRGGSPSDALAALEGTAPSSSGLDRSGGAARRSRRDISPLQRASSSTGASESLPGSVSPATSATASAVGGYEEVYEAVAAPRPARAFGTPQERAQRLVDERRRRQTREVGGQMIRELEAVLSAGGAPGVGGGAGVGEKRRSRGWGGGAWGERRRSGTTVVSSAGGSSDVRRGSIYVATGAGAADKRTSIYVAAAAATGLARSNLNSNSASDSAAAAAQSGVLGRRRPFSMYNIAPAPQDKRVASV